QVFIPCFAQVKIKIQISKCYRNRNVGYWFALNKIKQIILHICFTIFCKYRGTLTPTLSHSWKHFDQIKVFDIPFVEQDKETLQETTKQSKRDRSTGKNRAKHPAVESDRRSRDGGRGGEATRWVVTGLEKKELFHPAAIECSLPVWTDWACLALLHSQWWWQWRLTSECGSTGNVT
ncbi:hypothetical protein ILYODFUR_007017, partial [Ilyodon furcidens]